jgi:hypothetical protein
MGKNKTSGWNPRDYQSIEDLRAELDRFEQAQASGTLHANGGWSPGQILEHCAKLMRFSFDGFEASAPWFIKAVGVLVFKPMLGKSHMKPGIKLPAKAASLLPREQVPFEEGLAAMRTQLGRIEAGEKMTQASPVLGKMTHEKWVLLHLDHCRLHFGFLQCD